MIEFSDIIEDLELIDLPLDHFNKMKQSTLQKMSSDHAPVALFCWPWEQNKSCFKFENWWLNTGGFVEMISDWWKSFSFHDRPDYFLACKLKKLKDRLKE
ncbi:unnamed protein product [Withania somnifera]